MNFWQAIASGFPNYVKFSGRASRSEYWFWFLFVLLGDLAAQILDAGISFIQASAASLLVVVFYLVTLLPSLAVSIRRLHDIDRTGWWLLLFFIPLVGGIVLIVWFCFKGTSGYNRFGPDPLPAQYSGRHRVQAPQP